MSFLSAEAGRHFVEYSFCGTGKGILLRAPSAERGRGFEE